MNQELGTCCGCGTAEGVRTVACLDFKAPMPGRGWGCVVCDLAADGALAVLCDACAAQAERDGLEAVLQFACRGYPAKDGRVPYCELAGNHEHDISKHTLDDLRTCGGGKSCP
jgi:hypothetical protein